MELHEGPQSKLLDEGPNGKADYADDPERESNLRPIRSVFPEAIGDSEEQDQAQQRGEDAPREIDPGKHMLMSVCKDRVLGRTFLGGQAEARGGDDSGDNEQVPRRD